MLHLHCGAPDGGEEIIVGDGAVVEGVGASHKPDDPLRGVGKLATCHEEVAVNGFDHVAFGVAHL